MSVLDTDSNTAKKDLVGQNVEADEKSVQVMPEEKGEVFDSSEFRALGW